MVLPFTGGANFGKAPHVIEHHLSLLGNANCEVYPAGSCRRNQRTYLVWYWALDKCPGSLRPLCGGHGNQLSLPLFPSVSSNYIPTKEAGSFLVPHGKILVLPESFINTLPWDPQSQDIWEEKEEKKFQGQQSEACCSSLK